MLLIFRHIFMAELSSFLITRNQFSKSTGLVVAATAYVQKEFVKHERRLLMTQYTNFKPKLKHQVKAFAVCMLFCTIIAVMSPAIVQAQKQPSKQDSGSEKPASDKKGDQQKNQEK